MSLIEDIRKDMLNEAKAGNSTNVDILKMALAEIKNEEISLDKDLTDEEVLKVIRREEKKIKDSISEFSKMNRSDLVQKETQQLSVIQKYLPQLLGEDEIEKIVSKVISDTNAQGMGSMGLVMGTVMKELGGKADGNVVKGVVQKLLSK